MSPWNNADDKLYKNKFKVNQKNVFWKKNYKFELDIEMTAFFSRSVYVSAAVFAQYLIHVSERIFELFIYRIIMQVYSYGHNIVPTPVKPTLFQIFIFGDTLSAWIDQK